MKYNDLPVDYLPSADEVLVRTSLDQSPDWEHHPYIPVIDGDRLMVYTANQVVKEVSPRRYYPRDVMQLVVATDAWWLNNEHTVVAVRCKWVDRAGDVWWKKNSSMVWFFEMYQGEWQKLKLTNKEIKGMMDSLMAFQDLDW